MIAVILSCLASCLGDCSNCISKDTVVVACKAHAQEERDVLRDARLRFARAKDDAGRIEALEAIARTTSSRENAPSPEVAKALERGLLSPSPEVRERTLELLAPPQHAEATLEVLIRANRAWRRELEELVEYERQHPIDSGIEENGSLDLKKLQAAAETSGQRATTWRRAAQCQDGGRKLVLQLSLYPDERALSALAEFGWLPMESTQALVQFGSRGALQALLVWLERYDAMAEKSAAHIEELRTAKLPRPPKDWKGTPGAWEKQQEDRRDARIRGAERSRDELREHRAQVLAGLCELARKAQKAPVPAEESDPLDAWRRWSLENAEALPEHLVGVKGPTLPALTTRR